AKIAKTDFGLGDPSIRGSFISLRSLRPLCVFSERSFTHRDRKDYRDRFGLGDPSIRGSFIPLRSLRSSV
ncbi:MAG: hypothetical protein QOE88_2630, partial [Verrucomicrobiota bacterium]|nr:hypothetical protein [Verrucomicrobiota bacterium]